MSGEERQGQEQPRRRLINPRGAYPEVAALVDEVEELSSLAPAELRRYCGGSGHR